MDDWNITEEQYKAAIANLIRWTQEDLEEHHALTSFAGREFIAYVHQEPTGRFSAEVCSWGRNHGKVAYADTIDDLAHLVYAAYDHV